MAQPYAAPICNQPITFPVGLTVNGCDAKLETVRIRRMPTRSLTTCRLARRSRLPGHTSLPVDLLRPRNAAASIRCPDPAVRRGAQLLSKRHGHREAAVHACAQSSPRTCEPTATRSTPTGSKPPRSLAQPGVNPRCLRREYELITHTSGGALEFNDQINDQNLLGANVNYTQAQRRPFNNTSAIAGAGTSPIGYMTGTGRPHVLRRSHGTGRSVPGQLVL